MRAYFYVSCAVTFASLGQITTRASDSKANAQTLLEPEARVASLSLDSLEMGNNNDRQEALLQFCVRLDHGYRPLSVVQEVCLLTRLVEAHDPLTRQLAVEVLRRLGQDAAPAIPALVRVLGDPEGCTRLVAVQTLGSLEPASIPPLVEALKNNDARVRRLAAAALGRMGTKGRKALAALLLAQKSERDASVLERIHLAVTKIAAR